MQAGYSLQLGELVPAADAEYDDCAKFQITCPACREAVFKGFRTVPREIHYFSHYRAVDDASLCELRVAQLAKRHGIVDGFQGHEQTLKRFLSNFRDNIIAAYEQATGVNLRRPAMKIYIQPYMDGLAEGVFRETYASIWQASDPRGMVLGALSQSSLLSGRSPFWLRRAASYAVDALRHLDTEQASTNRRLLVALAFAAWPRRATDFSDPDLSSTGVKWMEAVATAASPPIVRRLSDEIRTMDFNEGYEQGFAEAVANLGGKSLGQLRQEESNLKAEIAGRRSRINALLASIQLGVPIVTLLALGSEGGV